MLRTLIVVLGCTVGFGAALHSRFGALLFYSWIAFFRPQDYSWVNINALRISAVSFALVVVPSLLTFRFPTVTHRLSIGAILFTGCALVGHQFAVNEPLSWFWLTSMFTLVAMMCFQITLTDTRERFVVLVAVITGSFAFFSAKAGLLALLRGGARYADGLYGAYSDNNAYAVGACMIVYPLVFVGQNSPYKVVRYATYAAAPLSALLVISTFSRAGFLSLVVSTGVYLLLQRRRSILLALALILAPLSLVVVPIPEGYFDRIQTIQTYEEDNESSALSRLYFWEIALDMAADNPLGVGVWQFQDRYDEYDYLRIYGRRRAVHNSFLQALTETGWAGGAIFALLFVSSSTSLLRLRSRSRDSRYPPGWGHFQFTAANSLLASTVAFVVGGSFISMAYNDLTWVTFGLVATLELLSKAALTQSASTATPVGEPVSFAS